MVERHKSISVQQKTFENYTKEIDEIKKPVTSAIGGILTYNDLGDMKFISSKFFNEQIDEVRQVDIDNAKLFIKQFINKFYRLKKSLTKDIYINQVQKTFLKNQINSNILKLKLFLSAIYIEAEKGGYKLTEKQKDKYLGNIEKIETIIYGPKVSEAKEETLVITNHLNSLLNQKSELISEDENNTFRNFLNKFEYKENQSGKEITNDQSDKIKQNDYLKIFGKALEIYGIEHKTIILKKDINEPQEEDNILYIPLSYSVDQINDLYSEKGITDTFKIRVSPKISSVSIDINSISIPSNYESLSTKRICELIDHEINTHLIRSNNHKKTINARSDDYLETEEGVATLNERLVTEHYENLTSEDPSIANIATLIGELNNFTGTKELLKIYYKLKGETEEKAEKTSKDRANRTKRFHSFDRPGAIRKDVSYRRGLYDAIEYIKKIDKNDKKQIKELQEDIGLFYTAKLGKGDMKNIKTIMEGFDTEEIVLPFALGKIIYEKLLGNKLNKIDDIRFLASERKLDYKQMKILLEIIDTIKKSDKLI